MLGFFKQLRANGRVVMLVRAPVRAVSPRHHARQLRALPVRFRRASRRRRPTTQAYFRIHVRATTSPPRARTATNAQGGWAHAHLERLQDMRSIENREPREARRIALVTGAAGALGAAIARALACRGHTRRRWPTANAAALEALGALSSGPTFFRISVRLERSRRRSRPPAQTCASPVGRGRHSGQQRRRALEPQARRDLARGVAHDHAVNLDGPYLLCRDWVPGMRERRFGRIINICSVAMKTGGLTAGTAYTASKGALGGAHLLARARARAARRDGKRHRARLRPQTR